MSKQNKKYINIVRGDNDGWSGLILEHVRIVIPFKSLDYQKKIDNIDLGKVNIQYKNSKIEVDKYLYDFPHAYSIEDINNIITRFDYIENSILEAGINQFDIIFDFYLNHSEYWWLLESDKENNSKEDYREGEVL